MTADTPDPEVYGPPGREMAALIDRFGRLTETDADAAMRTVSGATVGVAQARSRLAEAERALRRAVTEALRAGATAAQVAQMLGVSRSRVYQIRDGVR